MTTPQAPASDTPSPNLDACNVIWETPGPDARASMPLGNGDAGINAWVEPSGDLFFYIGKTDAWDAHGRLCRVGRVRVTFDPPLPVTASFRQELRLRDGTIALNAGDREILIWVDATMPVVRLEATSAEPVACRASVELWRTQERPFGPDDEGHSGRGLSDDPATPPVGADVVAPADDRVVWYHRNTASIYPRMLAVQHLEPLAATFPDPLLHHAFGASLAGEGMVADGPLALASKAPEQRHRIAVTIHSGRATQAEDWLAELRAAQARAWAEPWESSRAATAAWWTEFWGRSWIELSGDAAAERLTRAYVLQRFMNACSGRGVSPIKFNGSIFTVEARPGAPADLPEGDPDWRRWGGNYWFQNTRLAYWPMLLAGDFDLIEPWVRMYLDALPLAKARVRHYYGFDGAAQFPETMHWFGLPNNGDFGWNHTGPEPESRYIARYWTGCLELLAFLLDRHAFTGDMAAARDQLLPLAEAFIAFFEAYWPERDAAGKMRMSPAQSLETWQDAVNPAPEVAGLRDVLGRLLALPSDVVAAPLRDRWARLLGELPPLPAGEVDGVRVLLPAAEYSLNKNTENPELYAVFPFRLFGVGRPDLNLARATYAARTHRHNYGWCQDSIQAACLGLAEESARLVVERVDEANAPSFDPTPRNEIFTEARQLRCAGAYRFPAMWGPNYDWIPDQDHGNNLLTTLQQMLVQWADDTIYLLPAWPRQWDVRFKLRAPGNTTVTCEVRAGAVVALEVTPPERAKDVVVCPPTPEPQ